MKALKLVRHHTDLSLPSSACALGMFDGVHLGHQRVLGNAIQQAKLLAIPSVVFSFADHPQVLLSETPTQLLSTLDERLEEFEKLGFDYALILDFNPWLKNLSPTEFVDQILLKALGIKHVTVGYDHRFGKNRAGNGEVLKTMGQQLGFEVAIIEPVKLPDNGPIASSTLIRKLLSYGDIKEANLLLGKPYRLSGTVEKGLQRGQTLGFPTANLACAKNRVVPAVGTYGGFAILDGTQYQAVCNIGHSPTFEETLLKPRIEVHLLDYNGPAFYDQPLSMNFVAHLRDEMKFPTVNDLVCQIEADCQLTRHLLQSQMGSSV